MANRISAVIVTMALFLSVGVLAQQEADDGADAPDEAVEPRDVAALVPPEVLELLGKEAEAGDVVGVMASYHIRLEDGRSVQVTIRNDEIRNLAYRIDREDLPEAVETSLATVLPEGVEPNMIRKTLAPKPDGPDVTYLVMWRAEAGNGNVDIGPDGKILKLHRMGLSLEDIPEAAQDTLKALAGDGRIGHVQMLMRNGEVTYRVWGEWDGKRGFAVVDEGGVIINGGNPGGRGRLPKGELP